MGKLARNELKFGDEWVNNSNLIHSFIHSFVHFIPSHRLFRSISKSKRLLHAENCEVFIVISQI